MPLLIHLLTTSPIHITLLLYDLFNCSAFYRYYYHNTTNATLPYDGNDTKAVKE